MLYSTKTYRYRIMYKITCLSRKEFKFKEIYIYLYYVANIKTVKRYHSVHSNTRYRLDYRIQSRTIILNSMGFSTDSIYSRFGSVCLIFFFFFFYPRPIFSIDHIFITTSGCARGPIVSLSLESCYYYYYYYYLLRVLFDLLYRVWKPRVRTTPNEAI